MATEPQSKRLELGTVVEYRSQNNGDHETGRIADTSSEGAENERLHIDRGGSLESIDREQIIAIVERHPDRLTRDDVPPKPGYAHEINENVDDALEDALKTCSIAGETYLEALIAAELASFRYERGAFDE
ncbi:hypothetical protein [Natronosalvus amylolyticus]|uniref:hypothetical protein n=1 Tax=Natronosalvus amylolyticus TaxID=2961994 RepID=UPI0020C99B3D|nr:hypothetical protein [Natronosalvus amylolyticus]